MKIEVHEVSSNQPDPEVLEAKFFDRADTFIKQANEMCRPEVGQSVQPAQQRGEVSAAMLFATARFNVWVSANTFAHREDMSAAKAQVINYFMSQFQAMLEDQYDEYTEQFETYLRFRRPEASHTHTAKPSHPEK